MWQNISVVCSFSLHSLGSFQTEYKSVENSEGSSQKAKKKKQNNPNFIHELSSKCSDQMARALHDLIFSVL